jgi:deoxyadenosine/deoxycytidine kinase
VDSREEDREVLRRYYGAVEEFETLDAAARGAEARVDACRAAVLATQEHFIRRRAALLRSALREIAAGLAERHPTDDIEVFSRRNLERGLLTAAQFEALTRLMAAELGDVPAPRLHLFLHAAPARLRERIRARGRAQEADLLRAENPYLEELNRLYEEWHARCAGDKAMIATDHLTEPAIAERVRDELRARDLL